MSDLLNIPTLDNLVDDTEQALTDAGFKITNFRSGSIFKTLMMICLQGLVGLYSLVAKVSAQAFLVGATDAWLDLKIAELGVKRKSDTKSEGVLLARRYETGSAVKIPKGLIIKTDMGTDGKELRYIVTKEIILAETEISVEVPIIAEQTGRDYNVAAGLIKNPVKNIPGIDEFVNENDWLISEGTDKETDEALRLRGLAVWDTLATNMTSSAYKAVAANVNGVAAVNVDDEHPRGQGTVDIVIAGVAGEPTTALLEEVKNEIEQVKGSYDDVEVYGATAVPQDVTVTVYKDDQYGDADTIKNQAETAIRALFTIDEASDGTKLIRTSIVHAVRSIEHSKDVIVSVPAENITVEARQIITVGNVTVNVLKESEAVS